VTKRRRIVLVGPMLLAICLAPALHAQQPAVAPVPAAVGRTDSMSSARGGYTTTLTAPLSDSIVRLATGDSIEWQSFGPARVTGEPDGMLVTYHPFFELADTARVRRVAIVFFDSLRTKFTDEEPPFVVLRAVNLTARERERSAQLGAYGVVLEKREDGKYYELHAAAPIHP
jgi:hypothetical protein